MAAEPKKQYLYRLVDQLQGNELYAAERYLEYLHSIGDPFLRSLLSAPEEDEEVNSKTKAALAKARLQAHHREGRQWERVRKELGGE